MKHFAVVVNDCAAPPELGILALRSHDTGVGAKNFSLGLADLGSGLPRQLAARELDWLEILGHLYAVDLVCERGQGDTGWSRSIKAWLPVRDPAFWAQHRAAIEGIWTDLTLDELDLRFEQGNDLPPPRMSRTAFPEHDCIALLSGGQDSFVGALDLLQSGRRPLLLSHTASGAVNSAQTTIESILQSLQADSRRVKLSASKKQGAILPGSESSQRSRTFLFVGAAAVLATAGQSQEVYLNENGIMALHLPLTAARIGSLSTHTASPPILARMQRLASAVLGVPVSVNNTLVGHTKPEVVGRAVDAGHGANMVHTVSCWQIGRSRTHCGYCTPCIMRRISTETHALNDVEYERDVFEDPTAISDARARDNLVHFCMFVQDMQELSDIQLELQYPELLNAAPAIPLAEAIDLHRRWGRQAAAILFQHSVPANLL